MSVNRRDKRKEEKKKCDVHLIFHVFLFFSRYTDLKSNSQEAVA